MECQEHTAEITLVCITCDNKQLCPECLDSHTKGHDIQSLRNVASQIQHVQQLSDTLPSYSQHLSDIRLGIGDSQALQKEQDVLERQACDKINAQRQLLHQAIDESADNLVNICKERKQINLSALQDRENMLSSQITDITNNQSKINKLLQSKNFAEVLTMSKTVKPIKYLSPIHLKSFDFYTNQINNQNIDNILGQMTDSSEGKLTTVSTINSNTSNYASVIYPSVPGHAWVRWSKQNEIQFTDKQGHVTQTVKFNKQIIGMTATPDNRLLVCGTKEKCIYQVAYGSKPSVYFSTTLRPWDICTTSSGDLLVSMVDSDDVTTTHNSRRIVSRYSSKGQHVSDSAEYDSFGDRLFVMPDTICQNNTNTAVAVVNVTSYSPALSHLVLLDASLNLKLRYDGKVTPANKKYTPDTDVMFGVYGVSFTNECNILVTEGYSKSILLFDIDCQLLKILWRDDLSPLSLCLHNDEELWCSFYKPGGGVIKVIKPSTRDSDGATGGDKDALPPGWDMGKDSSGRTFYKNHNAQTTTWKDPRNTVNRGASCNEDLLQNLGPLPPDWEEKIDIQGRTYYVNNTISIAQWDDPRLQKLGAQK